MFRVFFAALLLNQQRVKCGAIPERAVSSVVERLVYTLFLAVFSISNFALMIDATERFS